MNFRHFFAYVGMLGLVVLVAVLISVRNQLVQFGPWLLRLIVACIAAIVLYWLFRAYHAAKRHYLATAAKQQEITHAQERHQLEMLALRANVHVQLSRIYPNEQGNYPILLPAQFLTPEEIAGNVMIFPAGQARGITGRHNEQPALPQQAESLHEEALPTNVRYEDIRHLVPRGHVLVGIGYEGIETKPQAVGACVWVVGLSGTGKTSTVTLRVEERTADNHALLGVDPHFFKDDSLYHAIYETLDGQPGPYADKFLLPMATTPEESLNVYKAFLGEFNARKSGQRSKPWQPITLLVDEVGAQMDKATATTAAEKEIIELLPSIARICGQEARNFQMGGIFISQQATGLAWLRKVALMVIVHQLLQESEKKLATNNDREVMEAMRVWPIGRTYIFGVGFQEGPRTVQQPYFSPGGYDEGEKLVPERDDQMEELQPNPLQSEQTALPITDYPNFEEDSGGEYGAFSGDFNAKKETDGKVLVFPENGTGWPTERSDCKTDEGLRLVREYRFTETEIIQFIAAYKAVGNIEKVLSSMKKGSGYKPHARELIQVYGLRKDA